MHRSSVPCVGCQRLFFPASLPIHQKTCFAKNAFVSLPCPTCHATLRTGNYFNHVKNCTAEPARVLQASTSPTSTAEPGPIGPLEADGRIQCRKCHRGFAPDRIAKHQSVCHEAERIKYVRDDGNQAQHTTTTTSRQPRPIKRSLPASLHTNVPLPRSAPQVGASMPALRACRKAPYDLVLRDASNQTGYTGAKYGGIDISNQTSAGNPLSRRLV
ncbi:hypothetical protein SPRG_01948 [Saprolegnia parasitica CBS 223.65]|uniref:C2HC/C3H-type domain-containing protein n=1 Tax=Saprolegnia parasitica (strain CBS 223.65) TaxID=695850 RepID=A0A067D322_SAPPC|nr:hypothetical protein SPRG_01948 [Saprolegnia parasitica CBS 223.65]KDO33136.1 hypothetical protein SPRG_01948 [Saprolegnia parasitica CBS 223.65]|eukprot:XP_012195901.1 hypothetical protein SPRG_01948 [Saprolegnia parasitica CBS 223.65]